MKRQAALSYPKLSISQCTTYTADIRADISTYRAVGADGIGLWEFKLPHGQEAAIGELLAQTGLRPTLCVPEVASIVPDPFFAEPKDPRERRTALCAAIRRFAPFDPVAVMVLTGAPDGHDLAGLRRTVVEGLKAAADTAGKVGVTLGLEPLRRTSGTLVTTLPETLELIEEAGVPEVGVIYDVWHLWDVPNGLDDLRRYAHRLVGVQVNDYRQPTRSWCDRLLPGEGRANVPAIFATLEAAGYDGWYDVEIFSDNGLFGNAYPDSLWDLPAEELARRAVASFRAQWDARQAPGPSPT
ncbi:MAG TPA: sugar phosphate isomerase/epimerase family protein [Candidatus Dormibacteraeota bacterium]|nr:sugar phosphate isomerase/epimerase family protein [Candidatus Dormibacteraeota bacterium]